jgi:thioesterase-3
MYIKQELVKEPESYAVIRFQDCDPFGHLNNGRYIDYFMNARTDQILEYYGVELLQEDGHKSWVVTKSQIAYHMPARMMERVHICTRLIHVTDRKLVVEGLMYDEDDSHLKALAWVEFTYIDLRSSRSSRHPDELMQLLQSIKVDGFEADFEQRFAHLRAQLRERI